MTAFQLRVVDVVEEALASASLRNSEVSSITAEQNQNDDVIDVTAVIKFQIRVADLPEQVEKIAGAPFGWKPGDSYDGSWGAQPTKASKG